MNKNFNHNNYLKEMEKNSKIFEEKLNKFRKSSLYNDDNDYQDKPELDIYNYSSKNKSSKFEIKFNPFQNDINNSKKNTTKNIPKLKHNHFFNNEEHNLYPDNIIKEEEDNYDYKKNYNKYKRYFDNIRNNDNDNELIEELRADIKEKSNIIKKIRNDLKEKEKLPSQTEYNILYLEHDKISNELEGKTKQIKIYENEIKNLKMKLETIYEKNKNLKHVINQKDDEIDNMRNEIDNMKDQIINSKNQYNDILLKHKKLIQDYDNLNKDYSSIKSENDNLNSLIDEQKAELFNAKKEIIELKKNINKLNSEIQTSELNKRNNNDYDKEIRHHSKIRKYSEYNDKNNYSDEDNEENTININKNKTNINKDNFKKNRRKELYTNNSTYRLTNRTLDDDYYEKNDFPSNKKSKNNKKKDFSYYEKTNPESTSKYNNNNETSNDEDNQLNNDVEPRRNNNLNSKYNYKYKRINKDKTFHSQNMDDLIFNINNELPRDEIKRRKSPEKIINENENEYIALLIDKDKIIGCDKEKIKELIEEREIQIVEKELSVLINEKEKLENKLLKMPEHPKKLNDIRNKREINEIIDKIQNDIGYIRMMLKKLVKF